jgi:hypothetical protein
VDPNSNQRQEELKELLGEGVGYVEHAEESVADLAAARLHFLMSGLPNPHPLRSDHDQILLEMGKILGRHSRGLRAMTEIESSRFDTWRGGFGFIPDIRPLGRPATADDVRAGRAVFSLSGQGTVAESKLPGWIILKKEAKARRPDYGLVVQAEKDPRGKLVYGVIFRHEMRSVAEDEVDRLLPYTEE